MDRSDVIKRLLYPKCKSAVEFQFDTLIVNPLLSYITMQDIIALNKIATSIRYSSKPKEKYKMIDNIMVPRGFKKMASGTNRVVYRSLNDYRVVIKIAIDKVGLSDNGDEYRAQHLLKPFVSKCFEVSPCGTVGLFERVNPITSREEFINISDDVFDLINNLIGKYVIEDIGEKFYMNYGLREGFGPVLLDYPYVFELDGRKLYCNCPDPMEPTGICGGEIDYDIGYNNLICTKCGKRYLATELRAEGKEERPNIIVKGEDTIMKCVLMRGNEVVSKLNSEEPVATNTIKPREEVSRLMATISRKEENEQELKYQPSIRDKDEVRLEVKLVGKPKSTNIDKNHRQQEAILEQATKHIDVDLSENTIEEKKEKFKAHIAKKTKTIFNKPEDKFKYNDTEITAIEPLTNRYTKLIQELKSDPNLFVARRTNDGEIWDVDKNELVGTMFMDDENKDSDVNETDEISEDETNDNGAGLFSIGEVLKDKLNMGSSTNENYTTEKIVSHIDNHYSSNDIKEETNLSDETIQENNDVSEDENEPNEIPEVIIHPRKEISKTAKEILKNY